MIHYNKWQEGHKITFSLSLYCSHVYIAPVCLLQKYLITTLKNRDVLFKHGDNAEWMWYGPSLTTSLLDGGLSCCHQYLVSQCSFNTKQVPLSLLSCIDGFIIIHLLNLLHLFRTDSPTKRQRFWRSLSTNLILVTFPVQHITLII